MKIKDSLFFAILIGALFVIGMVHVSLKNLLKESIFRSSEIPPVVTNVNSVPQTVRQVPLADSKQDLMNYIKSNLKQIHQSQDTTIKGSNFYSPYHQSDFHNEETDLSRYFQINQGVPDTTNLLKSLQCGVGNTCKEPVKPKVDPLSGNPMAFDQGSNGGLTFKPDIWSYENERPMNGGVFDGIRGVDTSQIDYQVYPESNEFGANANWEASYPYVQSHGSW